MKKVYIIINHFQVQDGVARTAIGLANELAKREDLEVTLQAIFKYDKAMQSWLAPRVKVKSFLGFYFRGLAKLVDLLPDWLLYKLLVREKYDIEIGFCMTLPIKIIAASSNLDCLHYAWMHGYDTGVTLHNSYKKMDKVFCVSKCNAQRFIKETEGKIPVDCCYNLVDDRKVCQMGEAPIDIPSGNVPTFVAVGRLEPGKGIKRLLRCCARLKQEGYTFRLWLVGDGEQRKELEKYVEDQVLGSEVVFLGAQRNPHAYTSKADVLVCASYSEGYSTACVEAIMLGIPVLTTCVSGAQEIIEEAQAGLMVEMDDEALYAGMKQILEDPDQIVKWKATLKQTKIRFSYENRARELARVLNF